MLLRQIQCSVIAIIYNSVQFSEVLLTQINSVQGRKSFPASLCFLAIQATWDIATELPAFGWPTQKYLTEIMKMIRNIWWLYIMYENIYRYTNNISIYSGNHNDDKKYMMFTRLHLMQLLPRAIIVSGGWICRTNSATQIICSKY